MIIYILRLEQGKYYVGKTKDLQRRFEEHKRGHGSVWTMKYKPLSIEQYFEDCSDFDEDKYTKIYMNKYGIANVRGGTYVTIDLTDEQIKYLSQEIRTATDACLNCGTKGHFIKNCPSNKIVSHKQTYNLFQLDNKTINEISQIRGIATNTIENHLIRCIYEGLKLNLDRVGHSNKYHQMIVNVVHSSVINNKVSNLKPIKERCPPEITYFMIRCSVALMSSKRQYPKVKSQNVGSLKIKSPKVESPKIKSQKVESPKIKLPNSGSSKVKSQKAESLKIKSLNTGSSNIKAPKIKMINKNIKLGKHVGEGDMEFIKSWCNFSSNETLEILYLAEQDFGCVNFDKINFDDIFVGVTNFRIFKFQEGLSQSLPLNKIDKLEHVHHWIRWDNIKCYLKHDESHIKIGIYDYMSCQLMCEYLKQRGGFDQYDEIGEFI